MRNRTWIFAIAGCVVLLVCGLGLLAAGGLGYVWYQQGAAVAIADVEPASVEYILDASPRMTKPFKGGTRLEVARAVLAEVVRPADAGVAAGLRTFGSGVVTTACEDTSLLVPVAVANQTKIADSAFTLEASTTSDSALAQAMIGAIQDLAGRASQSTLVVITGGADACEAQASELIKQAAAQAGITLQQFVIGVDLDETEEAAIKQLVAASGGTYLAALDAETLRNILLAIQAHIDQPSTTSLALVTTAATPGAVIVIPTPGTQATNVITVPGTISSTAATSTLGGYQMQTACDNPYNPLRPGATWNYLATGGGGYTWAVTVEAVTGDLNNATAEITQTMIAGGTYNYQWTCSPEGMQWASTGGRSPDFTLTVAVTNYQGQTLLAPALLMPGATWSEGYAQQSNSTSQGTTYTSNDDVSVTYTAGDLETLTTELGTFDVLTVVENRTDKVTSEGYANTSSMMTTVYYAFGVGPIRFVVQDATGGNTSELVSYTVPK